MRIVFHRLKFYYYGNHFTARWYDDNKNRQSKDIPQEIQDEQAAKDWLINLYSGNVIPSKAKTIAKLQEKWLELKEQEKIDTASLKQYRSNMQCWILDNIDYPHFSIQDVDIETGFTPKILRDYIRSIDRAPYTVRNIIQTLRTFFTDARGEEWVKLPYNPLNDELVQKVMPYQETVAGKNVIIHLNKTQANQLLACTEIRKINSLRYLLAIATGLRDAEIQGLQFRDILIDPIPMLYVQRQLNRKASWKGGIQFKQPKKGSLRYVPIIPVLGSALEWWKRVGWQTWTSNDPKESDLVFPGKDRRPYFPRSSDELRSDLITAGLTDAYNDIHPITFHALRRTFATLCDSVMDEAMIGAAMGHAGKSTTSRNYISRNPTTYYESLCKIPVLTVRAFG